MKKKKYLVRGGADPLKTYRPADLAAKNYIGGNSGNMMFLYGVINVLTTEDSVCHINRRKNRWSDEEVARINEEYDAVILPMADAFRNDYRDVLRNYTGLVRRLKIPCVVIGVGLRAGKGDMPQSARPFDEDVRDFVSAVLDHSSKIGLRGEATGSYLEGLGFAPGRDFTVIGCPSMYMHGTAIEERTPHTDKIGVGLNAIASDTVNGFYADNIRNNDKIHIIQQRLVEFMDWYYGRSADLSTFVPEYRPYNIFDDIDLERLKKEDRVHFFLDVPTWLDQLGSYGCFAGCRFHGVAAAVLAGVPAAITPVDSRTNELAAYHHLPQIPEKDMASGRALADCIKELDFSQFHKYHRTNLENYVSFLKANGLKSLLEEDPHLPYGSSVLEKRIVSEGKMRNYCAYECCSLPERAGRTAEYDLIRSLSKIKKKIKNV